MIKLNVKFIGKSITRAVEVPANCSVSQLRSVIAKEGVFEDFKIVFGGASLKDNENLDFYHIKEGSSLSVIKTRATTNKTDDFEAPIITNQEKKVPQYKALNETKINLCNLDESLDKLMVSSNELQQKMNNGIDKNVKQSVIDFEKVNDAEFTKIDKLIKEIRVNKFVLENNKIIERRERKIVDNIFSNEDKEQILKQINGLEDYIANNKLCASYRVSLYSALEEE